MEYGKWQEVVPSTIRGDSLWKMEAYRLALYANDLGWQDVLRLEQDHKTRGLSDQLCRALGSISANIAEGYSRGYPKERARFYEYALGSAREARDWYYKARHVLGDSVINQRLSLITQIIRLLLTMIPEQRRSGLKEEPLSYSVDETPPLP